MTKEGLIFKFIIVMVVITTAIQLGRRWYNEHASWRVKLQLNKYVDAYDFSVPEWFVYPLYALFIFMRIIYQSFGAPFILVGDWLLDFEPTTNLQSISLATLNLYSLYKILS